MKKFYLLPTLVAVLGGCSFVDRYEEQVHGMEPIYCYQSLGGVECLREPYRRDDRRLVNYFGPHPSRTEAPKPQKIKHFAPAPVGFWVKDPEPIPEPVKPMESVQPDTNLPLPPVASLRVPTRRETAPAPATAQAITVQPDENLEDLE